MPHCGVPDDFSSSGIFCDEGGLTLHTYIIILTSGLTGMLRDFQWQSQEKRAYLGSENGRQQMPPLSPGFCCFSRHILERSR